MSLHTLMFGWEYPPHHSGGLGVACQGLVRGLTQNGVQVTLVLPHNHASEEQNLSVRFPTDSVWNSILVQSALQPYDNVDEYALRLELSHLPRETAALYGPDLGQAVENYTSMAIEMTRDISPDVVHSHDWMTFEAGRRAANYHGKPLITHIHATELDRTNFGPNQWIMERERLGMLAADRIIAVSQYTKNILVEHYGIPADKIAVVHNGHQQSYIETRGPSSLTDHATRRPLVLFLGRMTIQKNPHSFLDVARKINDINPDVEFVMAGDGGMLPELIERACSLGLSDNVLFTGKVAGREIDQLYRKADCFVMPSLSEPFGLVALEAISHGTPVVLSKQSGVAEVVEHAYKVDFWDSDKMADCILTILREQPLAEQLRAEAPRVLQRLTWKNQANKVSSIYQDLINT